MRAMREGEHCVSKARALCEHCEMVRRYVAAAAEFGDYKAPEDFDSHPENHPNWWADQVYNKMDTQEDMDAAYAAVLAVPLPLRKAKYNEIVALGHLPKPEYTGVVVVFTVEGDTAVMLPRVVGSLRAGNFVGLSLAELFVSVITVHVSGTCSQCMSVAHGHSACQSRNAHSACQSHNAHSA